MAKTKLTLIERLALLTAGLASAGAVEGCATTSDEAAQDVREAVVAFDKSVDSELNVILQGINGVSYNEIDNNSNRVIDEVLANLDSNSALSYRFVQKGEGKDAELGIAISTRLPISEEDTLRLDKYMFKFDGYRVQIDETPNNNIDLDGFINFDAKDKVDSQIKFEDALHLRELQKGVSAERPTTGMDSFFTALQSFYGRIQKTEDGKFTSDAEKAISVLYSTLVNNGKSVSDEGYVIAESFEDGLSKIDEKVRERFTKAFADTDTHEYKLQVGLVAEEDNRLHGIGVIKNGTLVNPKEKKGYIVLSKLAQDTESDSYTDYHEGSASISTLIKVANMEFGSGLIINYDDNDLGTELEFTNAVLESHRVDYDSGLIAVLEAAGLHTKLLTVDGPQYEIQPDQSGHVPKDPNAQPIRVDQLKYAVVAIIQKELPKEEKEE